MADSISLSGIRDNLKRGTVGDFLKEKIKKDSTLSIVSAYFTIYAFEALKDNLLTVSEKSAYNFVMVFTN